MVLGCCPSCRGRSRRRWFRHSALRLWLCDTCGLGYSDPQPREDVDRRYRSQYDLAEHFGALEARKRVLNERRLENLPPASGQRRLLDIGCADGLFATMAERHGWKPHGVELNPPAARRARERGVDVVEGRLEDAGLPSDHFELVTAWDVIEHVPEPRAFIAEIARVVAPGGLVVVTTLNRRALVARVFRDRWSMVADEHFTYWDAASLTRAFSTTGMRATETSTFGLGRDFVTWVDRRLGRPSHLASIEPATANPVASEGRGWDAQPVALAAEGALNRLLDWSSLGVGVQLVLRAPANVAA